MSAQIIDHDELIIRMLASDDDQAVKILFNQYYELLSDVTYQLIHDRETCDDLIQELFINIWLKRHSLNLHKPLSHYLIRAVLNRARNYKRDKNRSKEILTDNFKEFESSLLSVTSDSSLHVGDIKKLLKQAKASMSPRTRVIFMLSRDRSMTYREIAVHLGISVKTVEKNQTIALRILRDALKLYMKTILLNLTLPLE
jgi:RNA polymerase sigma-70 factor (ECF subfamily)